MTWTEFTAVILCGYGEALYPLVDEGESCKALLPICTRPMLSYPLRWLERACIQTILIACHQESLAAITAYVKAWEKASTGTCKITVEAVSSIDETVGTADVVHDLADKIQTDFIVLGCDFVSSRPAAAFLDLHRRRDATVTALLYEADGDIYKDSEHELIGLSPQRDQLLYLRNLDDVEDDVVSVRMSLLWKHPRLVLSTRVRSAHVFVCKHAILTHLRHMKKLEGEHSRDDMTSFKDDFFPLLIKAQTSGAVRKQLQLHSTVLVAAHVYAKNEQDSFVLRAETLPLYMEANRHYAKLEPAEARVPASTTLVNGTLGSSVTLDSLIGEHSSAGERTYIKQGSVVGNHVRIGRGVRITACVVADYVSIGENCVLEATVIGRSATIGAKSNLKSCRVGGNVTVAGGTGARNEVFVQSDLVHAIDPI